MIGAHAPHGKPMTRPAIYLDHNAASPLLPEARAALVAALDLVGNASSVHGHGRALRNLIDTARAQVAALAGAERKQVVFTGSATEAITQAIVGGAKAFAAGAVVISAGEHAAVSKAAEATGLPVISIGLLPDGGIDLDQLSRVIAEAEGNLLVALLARFEDLPRVQFFWTFAVLMLGAATLFAIRASFYKYQTYTQ